MNGEVGSINFNNIDNLVGCQACEIITQDNVKKIKFVNPITKKSFWLTAFRTREDVLIYPCGENE